MKLALAVTSNDPEDLISLAREGPVHFRLIPLRVCQSDLNLALIIQVITSQKSKIAFFLSWSPTIVFYQMSINEPWSLNREFREIVRLSGTGIPQTVIYMNIYGEIATLHGGHYAANMAEDAVRYDVGGPDLGGYSRSCVIFTTREHIFVWPRYSR